MITDLEKLGKLEQKVAKIEMDLRKKQTTEAKLMEFATDANKFIEVIEAQTKRVEYLNQRLQAYINRECVLTEVSRYVRSLGSADVIARFHIQLMKAFAWDEKFWEQRGSGTYTIREWYEKIMKLDDVTPVQDETII